MSAERSAATVSELLDSLTLEELKAMREEIVRRIEEGGRDLQRVEQALEDKRSAQ